MLPDGWRLASLASLASVERGKFSVRPRNDPKYFGGDVPFVQTGDVANAGMFLRSYSQTLNEQGVSVSRVFPTDTILLTIAANIGATAITTFPVACPDSVVGIRPYPDKTDVLWLKYALVDQQTNLDAQASQNAQKNINLEVLKPLTLRVPPYLEQQRIGKFLVCWDEAIAITENMIVNSHRQKLALMEILMAGSFGSTSKRTPWRTYHLGEVFTERVETNRNDLTLLSITRDEGVIHREDVGRRDTSNEDKSKYQRICPGDIGYNTMRMWQGVAALSRLEGIVSPAYTVITPSDLIDGKYAAYLFKSPYAVFQFYRYSQGLVSDTWNLKFPHFAKIKIRIPDRFEQQAIVKILSAADEAITALERQAEKLKSEKRALMAQLLTGKRRVRLGKPEMEASI
jgi:type I restriction enzyme, S subunit